MAGEAPLPAQIPEGAQKMPGRNVNQHPPTRAVRLIFEYDGNEVRLVSQQTVDMAITDIPVEGTQRPGVYIDIRDAKGKTLARVPARNAFGTSAEVFPERPGEPIMRIDVAKPKGAFTIVVPVSDSANHVTVVRVSPAAPEAQPHAGLPAAGVNDLASFPLKLSQ
jgi:hypothetical protein